MMKPSFADMGSKSEPMISVFEGINTAVEPELLAEGSAADMKNIDSRGYPAICPRKPRAEIDITGAETGGKPIRYLGKVLLKKQDDPQASEQVQEQKGEYLSFVAGDSWWYLKDGEWTEIVGGGTYFSDNMDGVFFVDKNILVAGRGTNRAAYLTEEGAFSQFGSDSGFPICHFIISHANRLYVASRDAGYLMGSGLRKANVWTSATNSIAFEFDTPDSENCTAIASYAERLLFFKAHSIYEIYGTDPLVGYSTAKLSSSIGCVSHKTVREVSGSLFFLGDGAVYQYSGGSLPQNIGLPVQKYLKEIKNPETACAESFGDRYYLSFETEDGGAVLVYDTRSKMWYRENDRRAEHFAVVGGELYCTAEGRIWKMEAESGEEVEWYWHSKHFSSGKLSQLQNWKRLYIRFDREQTGEFEVWLKNDRGERQQLSGKLFGNVLRVELPPALCHRARWIQLQLEGRGSCRICAVERYVRTGGGSY